MRTRRTSHGNGAGMNQIPIVNITACGKFIPASHFQQRKNDNKTCTRHRRTLCLVINTALCHCLTQWNYQVTRCTVSD